MAQNNYWQNRLAQTADRRYRISAKLMNETLAKVYSALSKQMAKEVDDIYFKLLEDDITRTDIWTYKRYRDLSKRMAILAAKVGQQEEELMNKQLEIALRDVYNKTEFPGMSFSTMDDTMIKQLLIRPWSEKHYSQAIWDNKTLMLKKLRKGLTESIALGLSKDKAVQDIKNKCAVSFNDADRLVRTELMHTINAAQQQKYADNGIKYLEILVGEDERTCPFCSKMAGKKVPIDSKDIPPFHPRCRCTVIPVINVKTNVATEQKDDTLKEEYTKEQAIKRITDHYKMKFTDSPNYPMDGKLMNKCIKWLDNFTDRFSGFAKKNTYKLPEIACLAPSEIEGAVGQFTFYPGGPAVRIELNGGLFNKLESIQNYVKRCIASKWYPPNAIENKTFVHEYGHYTSHSLAHMTKNQNFEFDFLKECITEFKKTHPDCNSLKYMRDHVSEYATSSQAELFAEAFAEYYGGENPREFATIFGTKLDKILEGFEDGKK